MTRTIRVLRGYWTILGFVLFVGSSARADEVFVHEAVDTTGVVGFETSIALDAQGQPRISYEDFTNGGLKHASKSSGVWVTETIEANGSQDGRYTSLEIDALGNSRISYYGGNTLNGDLKYASYMGGAWTIQLVDSAGDVAYWTSLALGEQDEPRISYGDNTKGDLKYAAGSRGIWSIQTVDSTGFVGDYTSLALDGQGNPHIGYRAVTNWDLKYATRSGGTWILEIVDSAGDVGFFPSIALDGQGNPHISYSDGTPNWNVKYASKSGGLWTFETIDGPGQVGTYTSLSLDAQDNPHVAYYDQSDNDIKYARKIGSAWVMEVVATNSWDHALVLDPQGSPHLSYFDFNSSDLKYAVSRGPTSVPSDDRREARLSVAPNPVTGAGTSIQYRIASDGLMDLSLFDITGRRVSTLISGRSSAQSAISWNGRDEAGHPVATGTYFLRLTAGNENETRRITLIR
jgi:FlgD Ig-like domain